MATQQQIDALKKAREAKAVKRAQEEALKAQDSLPVEEETLASPEASVDVSAPQEAPKDLSIPVTRDEFLEAMRLIVGGSQSDLKAMLETVRGPRKISVGERTMHTPFNPTGKKRKLECAMFVNGFPLPERFLHDDEIDLLHQIKPGRYLNGKVLVQFQEKVGGREVHMFYNNKTVEQRMEMKGIAPTFKNRLEKVVQEQEAIQIVPS